MNFGMDSDACLFPFLYGERDLFMNFIYDFKPVELVRMMVHVLFGDWSKDVYELLEQTKGVLSEFLAKIKDHWYYAINTAVTKPFTKAVEQLLEISGIGEETLEELKDRVTVNGGNTNEDPCGG